MSESTESISALILAGDFYPKTAGGAFVDWKTAISLSEKGDRVVVVTPRNGDVPRNEYVEGVEILRPFNGPSQDIHPNSVTGQLIRIKFAILALPYLFYLCWAERFDLLYSTNHLMHPLAAVLRKVTGLPQLTFVGYSPSQQGEAKLTDPLVILERMNFRFFMGDFALCRTNSVKEQIQRLSNAPVHQMEGIVDGEAVRKAVNSDQDYNYEKGDQSSKQLVFVGRFVDVKNPTAAIEILSELPEDYRLLMIGDGPARSDVVSVMNERNVADRVRLAGQLSHEETLAAIKHSDLLLLTSRAESYGAVVFEALCLGTPVMATPVSILPTVDHPKLATAPLDEFPERILGLEVDSTQEVDEEALSRFSIERFATDVRDYMRSIIE